MTEPTPITPTQEVALRRRGLLRGGALAAVAAGAVVAGTARPAEAANGGNVVIGQVNQGTATTTLQNTTTARNTVPTLTLLNGNGPSLQLQALSADWDGQLAPGQLVGTELGPLVGVAIDDNGTSVSTYLATGFDLDALPIPVAIDPVRVLDTRNADGRLNIVAKKSASSINSKGQLVKGNWIDVAVAAADDEFTLEGIFGNAAVIGPEANGYLVVYRPGTNPPTSNVNFRSGVSLANSFFVGPGVSGNAFTIRIYSSATTHVLLDMTGGAVTAVPGPVVPESSARSRSAARSSRKRRATQRRALRAR